ncbi:tRNA (adenosine(37)-N6)-dimethylallyltransferase MiaA [Brochothrix campestris]|uniref:tRNA dimethylallyltransferase n=1 Tax=Brochothrix campestris FSL F6-1037 TaxID=1265861 RepID=W7D2Q6_9LIST|nr:tRNA (adenosine(37)-N6)-dimethylallyltransferase MiaA [Brochothrix campestris]EUJ42186.1 tRNA delta(2)-isopentenylpyrophosphate transferase [Brochothrix campestris FSL F6-1037]
MSKHSVVAIIGPTAVGKTALSLHLAKIMQAEIISGDSMQIYRQMDIGTAKASSAEQAVARHHMIDIVEPSTDYDVSQFVTTARAIIDQLPQTMTPLIVGGTGLYVQSLLYDFKLGNITEDRQLRAELETLLATAGNQVLFERLQAVDAVAAETIHPNNTRRVIRAIEVSMTSGKPFSQQQPEPPAPHYRHLIIGLKMDRELLYQRINARVDLMMAEGLVEEVRSLRPVLTANTAAQAIGYKEVLAYIDGQLSYDTMVELIKQRSRQYAKRQLTWFNNRMNVVWLDATDPQLHQKAEALVRKFKG